MSHNSEAREHSANNSTDPYGAAYRLQGRRRQDQVLVPLPPMDVCVLDVFVCEREKERKRGRQWMKIKRGGFCYPERDTRLQLFKQRQDPMTWSGAVLSSIWEYPYARSAHEIQEIPLGRADRFTSEAQTLENNLIWFSKLPQGVIRCQPSISKHFSWVWSNKKLLFIDSWWSI